MKFFRVPAEQEDFFRDEESPVRRGGGKYPRATAREGRPLRRKVNNAQIVKGVRSREGAARNYRRTARRPITDGPAEGGRARVYVRVARGTSPRRLPAGIRGQPRKLLGFSL